MNVINKIEELRKERNWSVNYLANEALLTQSTLSSMFLRNTPPKLEVLQCLCNAFNISLSQFFLEDENMEVVTPEEKKLLNSYRNLPDDKKQALYNLLR